MKRTKKANTLGNVGIKKVGSSYGLMGENQYGYM